jgi:predicted nucleotide-binding protein
MPTSTGRTVRLARLFIGSSSASLEVARQLKSQLVTLAPQVAVTVWDEAFRPGQLLLNQIVGLVDEYDFGVFVFAEDDIVSIRSQGGGSTGARSSRPVSSMTVRDNVLFEAGVFMGGLGHERTFLVVPRSLDSRLRTPTDLEGLLTANYRVVPRARKGRRSEADVSAAAKQIAACVTKQGAVPRNVYDEVAALRQMLSERELKESKRQWVTLEEIVSFAARARRKPWHQGANAKELMAPIAKKWRNRTTNEAYWWLVVYGIFRFTGIEQFTSDESWDWDESIEYVELSLRGVALLNILRERG